MDKTVKIDLDNLESPQQQIVKTSRKSLLNTSPEIEETFKHGVLSYEHK